MYQRKKIQMSVQRNGFGSIIRGECIEGHCFSMGNQFENKKRKYKTSEDDNDDDTPKRFRTVTNDNNVAIVMGSLLAGIRQTDLARLSSALNLPVNTEKL